MRRKIDKLWWGTLEVLHNGFRPHKTIRLVARSLHSSARVLLWSLALRDLFQTAKFIVVSKSERNLENQAVS